MLERGKGASLQVNATKSTHDQQGKEKKKVTQNFGLICVKISSTKML